MFTKVEKVASFRMPGQLVLVPPEMSFEVCRMSGVPTAKGSGACQREGDLIHGAV